MDVSDVLRRALAAVEGADLPDDLKPAAFNKAIDLISAASAIPAGDDPQYRAADVEKSEWNRLASALKTSPDRLGMVYIEHEGALQVAADVNDIGGTNKDRAMRVGLLIAGGRQLGGWDAASTADKTIRTEVERLGVYDPTNYSRHAKELKAWFNVNGSGPGASYRLKHPGRQRLVDLIKELTTAGT